MVQDGIARGYLFNPATSQFVAADGSAALTDAQLRALATTPGQEVTFTAVPTGSGTRLAGAL